MRITYDELRRVREAMDAPWFTAAWDLNLVIIRDAKVGHWGDWVVFGCLDSTGNEVVRAYEASGDAWIGEWADPTHPDGCVYVLDGHYKGGLKIGTHKGRPALVQNAVFNNVRWPKEMGRVPTIKELEEHAAAGHAFLDWRGTHIHNMVSDWAPDEPSKDSTEGCTLIRYQVDHAGVMELARIQHRQRGSDTISPTYCRRSLFIQIRR